MTRLIYQICWKAVRRPRQVSRPLQPTQQGILILRSSRVSRLTARRLFKNADFADIKIKVQLDDGFWYAHSAIICNRCAVFANALEVPKDVSTS
jgi:hypothetical protein